MLAVLPKQVPGIRALPEVFLQVLQPHFLPFIKVLWQTWEAHPLPYPVENIKHLSFLLPCQFSFHSLKRPYGIINEQEQDIPISPIRNLSTPFGLYPFMYCSYGIYRL